MDLSQRVRIFLQGFMWIFFRFFNTDHLPIMYFEWNVWLSFYFLILDAIGPSTCRVFSFADVKFCGPTRSSGQVGIRMEENTNQRTVSRLVRSFSPSESNCADKSDSQCCDAFLVEKRELKELLLENIGIIMARGCSNAFVAASLYSSTHWLDETELNDDLVPCFLFWVRFVFV